MASNVTFDILARDRASQTFDNVAKSSDGLGSKLGKLSKGALLGVGIAAATGAAAGIGALGAAMVQGVKDAASYQQLADKTAAVLKSTGNASHQSVKGIQARAAALESLSGVDEEVIINGQNVLATFTNIRDGVGKGNDIFNQATAAALNMSTALGQDMQSSTVQLGKALNDPIKGITALSRVGVSFTAQQKDQIKTLVKSGDTLGAQKVILKELNKEFGGAAKAAGKGFEGSMARAKDAVQDAFRAIGMKLLPVLTKVADYVATHAGPWIDKLGKFLHRMGEIAVTVGMWIMQNVIPPVQHFAGWIKNELLPAIQKAYQTVLPALKQAFSIVAGAFKSTGKDGEGFGGVVKSIGHFITTVAIPAISTIAKVVLPILASGLRNNIEFVKLMWKAFQTLLGIVNSVIAFILRRFADLTGMWSNVLRALAKVPGFGWAKSAADKLDRASGRANALASSIERIPNNKNVNVTLTLHEQTVRVSTAGNAHGNIPKNAKGTRNFRGGLSWVGEQGPELVYLPKGSDVYSNGESMALARGGTGGGGSNAGGDTFNVFLPSGTPREQAMEMLREFKKIKRQTGVGLGLD